MKKNNLSVIFVVLALAFTFTMVSCVKNNPGTPIVTSTATPVATAADAKIWTQSSVAAGFIPRAQSSSVAFNGKMWVLTGSSLTTRYNDIWNTIDGITWTPVTRNAAFTGRYGHSSAVFTNISAGPNPGVEKMWIIGGYNNGYFNDVWCSSDGIFWTQTTSNAGFGNRAEQSTVVYNGLMWVIAGDITSNICTNDVYSSGDGVNWAQVASNAGFPKRKQHSSVVFNNKMWVIGGYDNSSYYNDVWYSSNGITWYSATLNAAFCPRNGHTSLVYDNKMWVIGGFSPTNNVLNDCWYSTDGVIWTNAGVTTPFTSRTYHNGVLYDNKMWVIAGAIGGTCLSDVWWTQ